MWACNQVSTSGVQVVREAYPDATARQPGSKYYDPKASDDDPRWYQVDFKLVRVRHTQGMCTHGVHAKQVIAAAPASPKHLVRTCVGVH